MKKYFIDTSFLIALLVENDKNHDQAVEIEELLDDGLFITTHFVLAEFLNHFCEGGKFWRKMALSAVRELENDPRTEILPVTGALFRAASELYGKRADKGFSLTDCSSMIIMKAENIREVLSADHHFTQEGFRVLLDS